MVTQYSFVHHKSTQDNDLSGLKNLKVLSKTLVIYYSTSLRMLHFLGDEYMNIPKI